MRIRNKSGLISPIRILEIILFRNPLLRRKEEICRKNEEFRREIIREYSKVVEEIPNEFKQKITDRNELITPQESFLKYFGAAIPKYEFNVFKLKFAEIFCSYIRKYLSNASGKGEIDEFWRDFEVLFDGMPGSVTETKIYLPNLKIFLLRLKRIFFFFRRRKFK